MIRNLFSPSMILLGKRADCLLKKEEVAIVVDEYNRINKSFFEKLGITSEDRKI